MPNAQDGNRNHKRALTSLTPRLDRRLLGYAAAASAAGVGLLAQPAEATIVYTKVNVPIPVNGGLIQFDINNDGIPDFGFYNGANSGARRVPLGFFSAYLAVFPAKAANEVWAVQSNGFECAAALPAAVKVGPGAAFQPNSLPMWEVAGDYTSPGSVHCPWQNKRRGAYLGLKFVVQGQTHFGWARVTINSSGTTLVGYAYETVPNQAIHTGQTTGPAEVGQSVPAAPVSTWASLGVLAQGADGLAVWRRSEES
jgi:hypothetical protein